MTWLNATAYPLLRLGADFFEAYLVKNSSTGSYDLDNACALEGCTLPRNAKLEHLPQRNVHMTLGWIKATLASVLRASKILGIDTHRRALWAEIQANLAPYPTTRGLNGSVVFDECEDSGDWGGNSRYPVVNFGGIHPAGDVTRQSDPKLLAIARATTEQLNDVNRWIPENGLCMAWPPAAMVAADAANTMYASLLPLSLTHAVCLCSTGLCEVLLWRCNCGVCGMPFLLLVLAPCALDSSPPPHRRPLFDATPRPFQHASLGRAWRRPCEAA